MNAIKTVNLKKMYGKSLGINNISLDVKEGEIYGFVGQNGAGKSTTIRIFLNMIFSTSGMAEIFGKDCVKYTREIKGMVSYVPSEVSYYPNMKVVDILKYSAKLNDIKDTTKIETLCSYFELEKQKLIRELSLGNRKKVSLVIALLKEPKIIILDEPTSGLDPLIQDKLFQYLLKEKEKGTTIFLSSHNLSEVEKYCDRVCVIKKGEIVEVAELSQIKQTKGMRVSYTTKDNKQKSYIYEGDINALTKELTEMDLINLEIRHTTLEEKFMKYYQSGGTE